MRRNAILVGLTLALGMAACEDLSTGSTGNEMARVNLKLTDAPAELTEASVQIRQIYLVGSADDTLATSDGRIVLFDGDKTFDLLDLQNGVTADLASVVIPAGTYRQLRFVIGDASITTKSGSTFSTSDGSLKCPSCSQSGLKVRFAGDGLRIDPTNQVLVLDFDVAQSFGHQAGKSGKWIMHPVITATRAETAGGISGTVALATGVTFPTCGGAARTFSDFLPVATRDSVSLTATPDSTGAFNFSVVPAGTYTMTSRDTVSFTNGDALIFAATPSAATATVTTGSTATVNYTINSATCTPAA